MRVLFRRLDTNQDDTLDIDEFLNFFAQQGKDSCPKAVMELFKLYDADRSGAIDFDEFCSLMESVMPAKQAYMEAMKNGDVQLLISLLDYQVAIQLCPYILFWQDLVAVTLHFLRLSTTGFHRHDGRIARRSRHARAIDGRYDSGGFAVGCDVTAVFNGESASNAVPLQRLRLRVRKVQNQLRKLGG